ncbi:carboxypeptidase M32 [Phaeobacter gallaeciensis]|uniref:Metal-dependent carboxypeptidase n=1 Tax=Phaeobacter gallaeciensis TaxID=60890 RepID=A0AAC9Z7Z2_9RHOB|nr:carboxypeptidase M32 [Phaeobacter gallaeciensis]AHD09642.1 Zn-dependent carboxypeptidase [Phaeobacter gallaeciensis DSM 26640]ATE92906.1 thermostable carboxypeptidase 1 [Phaeobacter gallaeciensis]ATE97272.1 thermostable carboxypeptidase 1 [Phaeobacter gallaeciensis]ATF01571.1 thermostable carboxypeptidase 1 [Phaeobacter gallaeciensis]ATF05951.1 thermostable carboxypeptidase 1 [Phaeobacter gallaeciensis]
MSAFDDLMAYERDTQALGQIAGRLGWDQETMMPRGAAPQRGEEMAAIEAVLHARRCDPQVADWLARAEAPDEVSAAQLREIRRSHERAVKVPGDLAKRIARVTSEAQGKWAAARAAEDVAAFLPVLEEVVALKREEGQALAAGGDVYDAMIADYEHGTTAAEIAALFDAMRPRLVDLRARVLDKPAPKGVSGHFDADKQMALTTTLAETFGYQMRHGRVDKAVHPFCSGSGLDVRVTTRTSDDDPFNCFYSTIHEVGHAAYEQNIDQAYLLTPLGRGVSMGVHESQSRIYENQLGRSRAFTGWLFDQMVPQFGDFGIADADAFYAAVNAVHNGYIRTEADELQYNLHVMMRFDLERALMSGDLQVQDLEAAWNDRFAADFGYGVDKPSNGCLQDVHWSVGLFGYFPTYSLGNVYAGCLYQALRQAVPDLDKQLAAGDTVAATNWLRDNLQTHGGLRSPVETITHAAGMAPSPEPLLSYLEEKFGALYGL